MLSQGFIFFVDLLKSVLFNRESDLDFIELYC